MDADDRGLLRNSGKAGAHRLAPTRSACDGALARCVLGRDHDHDTIGCLTGDSDGAIDHSHAAESLVLLGGAEPPAAAAADHNGPDLLGTGHIGEG